VRARINGGKTAGTRASLRIVAGATELGTAVKGWAARRPSWSGRFCAPALSRLRAHRLSHCLAPAPAIDPALASPQVLTGFDAAGAPQLRLARQPITLRHLLTHTAGFTYRLWDADALRYARDWRAHPTVDLLLTT
jgi:hypothetical protein